MIGDFEHEGTPGGSYSATSARNVTLVCGGTSIGPSNFVRERSLLSLRQMAAGTGGSHSSEASSTTAAHTAEGQPHRNHPGLSSPLINADRR